MDHEQMEKAVRELRSAATVFVVVTIAAGALVGFAAGRGAGAGDVSAFFGAAFGAVFGLVAAQPVAAGLRGMAAIVLLLSSVRESSDRAAASLRDAA